MIVINSNSRIIIFLLTITTLFDIKMVLTLYRVFNRPPSFGSISSHVTFSITPDKLKLKISKRFLSSHSSDRMETDENISNLLEISTELNRLVKQSTVWCGLNGLMYTDGNLNWNPAPISLLPAIIPQSSFNYAITIQPIWNKLIDKISRDRNFINDQLKKVSENDKFIKKLLFIYNDIPNELLENGVQCGIHRSDYMIDSNGNPLQIEINTIASSFGCLSKKVYEFQNYIVNKNKRSNYFNRLFKYNYKNINNVNINNFSSHMTHNPSIESLASILSQAYQLNYLQNSIILFVVQPGERNIADQRLLESEIYKKNNIDIEFRTLTELYQSTYLDKNNNLILKINDFEEKNVSVVYFRSGYSPNDYFGDKEWNVRSTIEISNSIKCPSVGYQLTGSKVIQATLSMPDILENYLNKSESELIRKCFVKQYHLDKKLFKTEREFDMIIDSAIKNNGKNWVLKPQREGGGNNFYNKQLSDFLGENRNNDLLAGYVLMERIFPTVQDSLFLRNGNITLSESISELGIYGTFLSDNSNNNNYAGYLLRTKQNGIDEGGVATGYSVLNSILLY